VLGNSVSSGGKTGASCAGGPATGHLVAFAPLLVTRQKAGRLLGLARSRRTAVAGWLSPKTRSANSAKKTIKVTTVQGFKETTRHDEATRGRYNTIKGMERSR
jgi:hypothetical protein